MPPTSILSRVEGCAHGPKLTNLVVVTESLSNRDARLMVTVFDPGFAAKQRRVAPMTLHLLWAVWVSNALVKKDKPHWTNVAQLAHNDGRTLQPSPSDNPTITVAAQVFEQGSRICHADAPD